MHFVLGQTLLALRINSFELEMNTLVLEKIAFKMRIPSRSEVQTKANFKQRIPSRIYVEIIAIVTTTCLSNGHYHVEEIQRVCRRTTMSSVALNWSSRSSKYRKL